MPENSQWGPLAGMIIILAFFALVAYIVSALRHSPRLTRVLITLSLLLGALPAVTYTVVR